MCPAPGASGPAVRLVAPPASVDESRRRETLRVSRFELRHDHRLYLAAIDHREQALHSKPVQVLRGLAAIDVYVDQFHTLHDGNRADLRLLRLDSGTPRSACLSLKTLAYPTSTGSLGSGGKATRLFIQGHCDGSRREAERRIYEPAFGRVALLCLHGLEEHVLLRVCRSR